MLNNQILPISRNIGGAKAHPALPVLPPKNSKIKKIGNGKSAVLENDDEILINRPDHFSYKFRLLRLHFSGMLDENDEISASQRCRRGTPQKSSPSSVN